MQGALGLDCDLLFDIPQSDCGDVVAGTAVYGPRALGRSLIFGKQVEIAGRKPLGKADVDTAGMSLPLFIQEMRVKDF